MSTHRLFNLIVVVALVAVIVLTAQTALSKNSSYRVSNEQVQREYKLGERYGEIPSDVAQFSAEQILREYILGERYGVTPQKYAINAADQSASDFHQRHPEWTWVIRDASVVIPVTGDSAYPDYYQRHPELMAPVRSIDLTDYYFRHPGQ